MGESSQFNLRERLLDQLPNRRLVYETLAPGTRVQGLPVSEIPHQRLTSCLVREF